LTEKIINTISTSGQSHIDWVLSIDSQLVQSSLINSYFAGFQPLSMAIFSIESARENRA